MNTDTDFDLTGYADEVDTDTDPFPWLGNPVPTILAVGEGY